MRNEEIVKTIAADLNLNSNEKQKCLGLLELFDKKDADKSGTLSMEECVNMFGNRDTARKYFTYMDLDQNQKVSKMEFLRALNVQDKRTQFQHLFNEIDTDDDCKINLEELKVLLNKSGCAQSLAGRMVARFNECDKNKDGGLEFEEFLKFMCQSLK